MTLSPAATAVLTRAAERPDHRLEFPRRLPAVARRKMIGALLREGLAAGDAGAAPASENPDTGLMLTTLVLTDAGSRAISREPAAAICAKASNTAPHIETEAAAPHGRWRLPCRHLWAPGARHRLGSGTAVPAADGGSPPGCLGGITDGVDVGEALTPAIAALRHALANQKPARATAPRRLAPTPSRPRFSPCCAAPPWLPHAWTASPAGRTPCRNCWRRVIRCGPSTCRVPTNRCCISTPPWRRRSAS
jgi:hypothetical protein